MLSGLTLAGHVLLPPLAHSCARCSPAAGRARADIGLRCLHFVASCQPTAAMVRRGPARNGPPHRRWRRLRARAETGSTAIWHDTYLTRGKRGLRSRLSVFGRWKITDLRTLRSFLKLPFFTALAAALALLSLLLSLAARTHGARERLCRGLLQREHCVLLRTPGLQRGCAADSGP